MAAAKTFHVRPTNDGTTLATALRKMLGESTSWGDLKRLIANRHIHVNGNLCVDEGRHLRTGDVVHVFDHSQAPLPTADDIIIRYIDAHLVIIEKPAGLNTLRHREEADLPQKRKDKAPTLEELVQKKVADRFRAGDVSGISFGPPPRSDGRGFSSRPPQKAPPRPPPPVHPLFARKTAAAKPGSAAPLAAAPKSQLIPWDGKIPDVRPVHRLDRDTSGLMLFALTPQAEMTLERDFARHSVERIYTAVVRGHLREPRTIESHIVRDRGDTLRGSGHPNAEGAQRALTHIKPLESFGASDSAYSIVECQLETGRTHQIRIHLSEAGHPLAGEKTYTHALGHPPANPEPLPAPRHALHSTRLKLTHPITGTELRFESALPRDLAGWLKKVRNTLA